MTSNLLISKELRMQTDIFVAANNPGNETDFYGEIRISGKVFAFSTRFRAPISEYVTFGKGKTVAQLRELIPITLTAEGKPIELTNVEWEIFYYPVVRAALAIHALRVAMKAGPGTGAAMGGTSRVALKPEACVLLAQPKFGCQFLDATTSGHTQQ